MSAARYHDALKPLAPGDRVARAVNAERQNALATLAQEAVQGVYIKGSGGIRVRNGAQGVNLSLRRPPPRRGGFDHPWRPKLVSRDETTCIVTLTPGFFAYTGPGTEVTIEVDAVDEDIASVPRPPLELAAGSTRTYVYLDLAIDVVYDGGFVVSADILSRKIVTDDAEKTSTDTHRYYELFRWMDNKLEQQSLYWSQGWLCRDDGTATSTPAYYTWTQS